MTAAHNKHWYRQMSGTVNIKPMLLTTVAMNGRIAIVANQSIWRQLTESQTGYCEFNREWVTGRPLAFANSQTADGPVR